MSKKWNIHFITDRATKHNYTDKHTHGMETYKHLNFQLVVPYGPKPTSGILNSLCDMVAAGRRFSDGELVDDVLEDCQVKLFRVKTYDDKDVFRVIVPDDDGRFPEDAGCDKEFKHQYEWMFDDYWHIAVDNGTVRVKNEPDHWWGTFSSDDYSIINCW